MSELQNDGESEDFTLKAPETTQAEEKPSESAKAGSELATESPGDSVTEGEKDKKDDPWAGFSDEQKETAQRNNQKAINKQHYKFRDEERKRIELEGRVAETERKISEQQGVGQDVVIPEMPDSFDDDYDVKVKQRDEAILQKGRQDQMRQSTQDQTAVSQQEQERRDFEVTEQRNNTFMENASKLGVDTESLAASQSAVVNYGIPREVAAAIVEDDIGPLIVQHLAANPLDLHDLVNSEPMQSGIMFERIKIKAASLKPKSSAAPSPSTDLGGRGVPEVEKTDDGCTYE